MNIEKKTEHEIPPVWHEEISILRDTCFPEDAVGRSYFKQFPHFRFLAFRDGSIVGHMGVDHRVISITGRPYTIFGVIDLCVAPNHRRKGIAGRLLDELQYLARKCHIDFCLLFANDHRLYRSKGFRPVCTQVTWLKIDEHIPYGIGTELFQDEFMVLQTGDRSWPEGNVDLLGYLF
jgi:predicted N-acetyltransferase YhbS